MTAIEKTIENIIAQKARTAVYDAVRAGRLVKPDACELCGTETTELDGHHGDYEKPLEVVWLCSKCHARIHADMREKAWRELGGKYRRTAKAEGVRQ